MVRGETNSGIFQVITQKLNAILIIKQISDLKVQALWKIEQAIKTSCDKIAYNCR